MKFLKAEIPGAYVIETDRHEDDRGFFGRSFCRDEFQQHGIPFEIVQSGISFNRRKGTVRGMHFQVAPKEEPKLIRCTRGSLHDVLVDLRRDSPTYCRSFSFQLTAENRLALYAPPGVAHGFQTLEDETEIFYELGQTYAPDLARGFRWNDPAFAIRFPLPITVISEQDLSYVDFKP